MEQGSRTRLVTAAVLAVVFASGAVLGLALDRGDVAGPAEVATTEGEGEQPERERRRRRTIYAQVGPTEDQQVRIDSIVREHRTRMRALNDEFRSSFDPRYQAILHDTREGIAGVFTPEQAEEYRQRLAEFDRRRAERRGNRDK